MPQQLPSEEKPNSPHSHPAICCCDDGPELGGWGHCPACPVHAPKPAPIGCPQCHTPIGQPHTNACTLAPDAVWTDQI